MIKLPVNYIVLLLTEQCNMKCKYCFEKNAEKYKEKISKKVIKKSIDILMKTDNPSLEFLGGEPTLCENEIKYAFEYVKNNYNKKLNFNIITNLFNISDNLIETFKQINDYSKLQIWMTLDGTKETNDLFRIDVNKKPTFDKIMNNVKRIKKKIPNIHIEKHQVFTDYSLDHIEEIFNYTMSIQDEFNYFTFGMPTIGPTVFKEYELSKKSLENYIKFYFEKVHQNINNYNSKEKEIVKSMFYKFLPININYISENTPTVSVCEMAKNMIVVRSNGDVIPCVRYIDEHDFEDRTTLCNLNDYDKDAFYINENEHWYKYFDNQSYKTRTSSKTISELDYECEKCPMFKICPRCIASCELMTKDINVKSKILCRRELMIAEITAKFLEVEEKEKRVKLLEDQNEILRNILEGSKNIEVVSKINNNILKEMTDKNEKI